MYRGNITETVICTKTEDKGMDKRFIFRILALIGLSVFMLILMKNTVYAQVSYQQFYARELIGADISRDDIMEMSKYVETHISVYDENITYDVIHNGRRFAVIVVTDDQGIDSSYELLESREMPVVVVRYGHMVNMAGDGILETGGYIGYRVYNTGETMQFTPWARIRTITVYAGNNKYVDCFPYRMDVCIKRGL